MFSVSHSFFRGTKMNRYRKAVTTSFAKRLTKQNIPQWVSPNSELFAPAPYSTSIGALYGTFCLISFYRVRYPLTVDSRYMFTLLSLLFIFLPSLPSFLPPPSLPPLLPSPSLPPSLSPFLPPSFSDFTLSCPFPFQFSQARSHISIS